MRGAWWAPVVQEPGACAWGRQRSALVLDERTRPRCIMVNRQGRRFVNEAASYNAIGAAFHAFDVTRFEYPNVPAWMVFDHEHLRRYGFLGVAADGPIPEWFNRCETLSGLAVRTGLARGAGVHGCRLERAGRARLGPGVRPRRQRVRHLVGRPVAAREGRHARAAGRSARPGF